MSSNRIISTEMAKLLVVSQLAVSRGFKLRASASQITFDKVRKYQKYFFENRARS